MTRTPITDPDDLEDIDEDGNNARKMMMSPEEVIEIRRMEVIRRRLRGQTAGTIARALNVSENTIYNDIKAIKFKTRHDVCSGRFYRRHDSDLPKD